MMIDPFQLPPEPAPLTYVGPFDREPWPDRLTARVVSTGVDPRIRGYAVAELARDHGVAEVAWLALRGELPTAGERAALDAALVLLAPVHIGQAASHAAFLSRIAGARPGATVAIAAVGLGELARTERDALAPWWAWLAAPTDEVPACALAAAPDASAGQAWLDGALRDWLGAGLPRAPLTRVACAHAILFRLGLRDPLVVDALTVWARLPAVIAEASHAGIGAVRDYPARVPDYRYVDREGAAP